MINSLSRRSRLLAQFAIVDIADRDRPSGQCATEVAGEFQRLAGVKRRVDRLEIGVADISRNARRGVGHPRGSDDSAVPLETESYRHLHALARGLSPPRGPA